MLIPFHFPETTTPVGRRGQRQCHMAYPVDEKRQGGDFKFCLRPTLAKGFLRALRICTGRLDKMSHWELEKLSSNQAELGHAINSADAYFPLNFL